MGPHSEKTYNADNCKTKHVTVIYPFTMGLRSRTQHTVLFTVIVVVVVVVAAVNVVGVNVVGVNVVGVNVVVLVCTTATPLPPAAAAPPSAA